MSHFARRKDSNHSALVDAFRAHGCSVLVLDVSTKGAPDLLIGRNGDDQLVEVKPEAKASKTVNGQRLERGVRRAESEPREAQVAFARAWRGRWVDVARNLDDVAKIANGLGRT